MKRNKFLTTLTAAVALILGTQASAQSASEGAARGGTIEGRVFDPRRGEYLENARITIEGTQQEVLTDATGAYRLSNVPAGTAKLVVFYTGLGSRTELVTVSPGATAQRDITFAGGGTPAAAGEVVELDTLVVSSSKEMDGAAIAINTQRFARSIINVVAADEFGTVVDGTPGEVMKFLPGITL
ncbi:MAG: carboxypeptidase regulatory-like domain-containing protein, partial [Opitutaceae bacterium]